MRALRYDGQSVRLETIPTPSLLAGHALLSVRRIGLCSTELAILAGRLAFRGTLGHECVATVAALADEAPRAWLKKRVIAMPQVSCAKCDLCRGGLGVHCRSRTVAGLLGRDGCAADAMLSPLTNLLEVPASLDDERAIFAYALGVALHAAGLVRLEAKPYVTIIGDGPVGLLAAQVMARRNTAVRLLGKTPERFTLCERWGVKHRALSEVGLRQDQDVVFDCTGTGAGFAAALHMIRPRGKLIIVGPPVAIASEERADWILAADSEIEVLGARSARLADALTLLAAGTIDVLPLISGRFRLEHADTALAHARRTQSIKVLLEP